MDAPESSKCKVTTSKQNSNPDKAATTAPNVKPLKVYSPETSSSDVKGSNPKATLKESLVKALKVLVAVVGGSVLVYGSYRAVKAVVSAIKAAWVKFSEKFTAQEPAVKQPAAQAPAIKAPVIQEPAVKQPAAQTPSTSQRKYGRRDPRRMV
ncbi:MAG: hypothetical protein LBB15_01335 [Puniceicoccales bacterium]|nr:hypothetical protein [Puniceicoccales bacterium]